jgi:hypothetical protein
MPGTMANAAKTACAVCGGVLAAALLVLLLIADSAGAAVMTFGSSLSVPATLNTSEDLSYPGTNTAVPPNREYPSGEVHTSHYGSDTALWNTTLASGTPRAQSSGQVLKVSLEGCAQAAPGGPPPLTQIHFQDLSPLPGGGAKVNVTSQPFDIPICGQDGAGANTRSIYEPTNLCVNAGDYLGFNDEGGYVENYYRSGVPYQVIGAVDGSTLDSFIRSGGTGNGAVFSPADTTAMDGFATTESEELMLQATLGTGPDATPLCPGGTSGVHAPAPPAPPSTPVKLSAQTDGVNHARVVAVAIFCRLATPCSGTAELSPVAHGARRASFGSKRFSIPAKKTSHVPIRVSPHTIKLLRQHRRGERTALRVAIAGKLVTQTITLKIF